MPRQDCTLDPTVHWFFLMIKLKQIFSHVILIGNQKCDADNLNINININGSYFEIPILTSKQYF